VHWTSSRELVSLTNLKGGKNEVCVGDWWCCEWTWERSHCQQYWPDPQSMWS